MTNSQEIKNKLGKHTEQLETKTKELFTKYSPYYTKLEPWQRGMLIIALILCLLLFIYYLTATSKNRAEILREKLAREKEIQSEEKLLRQMAFFKKLQN